MEDGTFFKIEGIINWPKIKTQSYANQATKDITTLEKFSAALYFTEENYKANLKKCFEAVSKQYTKARLSIKKIKEVNPDIAKILGDDYIYQHQITGQVKFINCKDLYSNKLPLNEIKSGDRVYIKGSLKETKNPENPSMRYITMYVSSIAKIEDQVYEINSDRDFDDDLAIYQKKYSENNTDPDVDEDIPEWEK